MSFSSLRQEIAAAAARMIAEDGLDYSTAKRKAVRLLVGPGTLPRGDVLPDNDEIESEVRDYQALFMGDTQPARLASLRQVALSLMELLEPFRPYLAGPVWNGTAGEHTDIALQCFADSSKEVEIFLINRGIKYEVGERPDFRGRGKVEALYFVWQDEGVMLSLYDEQALRGALKPGPDGRADRGDARAVARLIDDMADTAQGGRA
ncbi:hypothetical protein PIGHUM_01573 [Pigmentiphaga humi]|uniref:UDP-N-acetylmuramate--alanine ligase n=1 Tax=Pigmentiphaga humi TaxID=2478468 RepID=A0A3P4B1D4_9BURK|nr:hypothetical protein [Pigmentiphaga humi]VCU69510.1 hypothetical protein PIGHUM_01573 [Pigmentiphaga humi]